MLSTYSLFKNQLQAVEWLLSRHLYFLYGTSSNDRSIDTYILITRSYLIIGIQSWARCTYSPIHWCIDAKLAPQPSIFMSGAAG